MRWLITGARGQLGRDLVAVLAADPAGAEDTVVAHGSDALDITDRDAIDRVLDAVRPDVVVNTAAYTAVDAAETDEDAAYQTNAVGPALLAVATARAGARLVHLSTDYVFAGDAMRPYAVADLPAPASAYGRTKLAGELGVRELNAEASWVVRTAWVWGAHGHNFVKTMIKLEGERETLDVVDDQRGAPTWSADLARGLVELVRVRPTPGIYHCTGGGETTWFGLARAIFAELGADPERVRPTTTDRFPRPAPRPAYSVLSDESWVQAGLTPLQPWPDALHQAFAEVGPQLRSAG